METLAAVEEVERDWLTVESKVYVIAVCMSIYIYRGLTRSVGSGSGDRRRGQGERGNRGSSGGDCGTL